MRFSAGVSVMDGSIRTQLHITKRAKNSSKILTVLIDSSGKNAIGKLSLPSSISGSMSRSRRRAISRRNAGTVIVRSSLSLHYQASEERRCLILLKMSGETQWSDVDLENGTLEILGKSREYQYVVLLKRVWTALERYRRIAEPPTKETFVLQSQNELPLVITTLLLLTTIAWL